MGETVTAGISATTSETNSTSKKVNRLAREDTLSFFGERNGYSYSEAVAASLEYFNGNDLAARIFVDKYALRDNDGRIVEKTPRDMHHRLAKEFARIEKKKYEGSSISPLSEEEIFSYLDEFKQIIPQGSPMSAVGNPYQVVSTSNCFVIDSPLDSYGGICLSDEELVQISKRRGGVGLDISNLRPAGSLTHNAARTSTGIIPFMSRFSNSIREVGQCLHKNTLVLASYGLVPISEILSGDQVWTALGWVTVLKNIKNKKRCIKITTCLGKEIACSKDHVFHTVDGEKRAGDFVAGDCITNIIGQEYYGKEINLKQCDYKRDSYNNSNRLLQHDISSILEPDLAYLIGYSYGDGCKEIREGIHKSLCLSISSDLLGIKERLQEVCEKYEFPYKCHTGDDCERMIAMQSCDIQWLEDNDLLKQESYEMPFPALLLKAKKDILFAFIAGFFDAEGTVKRKKLYRIYSVSKQFLLVIQNILSSYGIISRLDKDIRGDNCRDLYSLSITTGRSQKIFVDLVENYSIKAAKFGAFTKNLDCNSSNLHLNDVIALPASKFDHVIDKDKYVSYSTMEKMCCNLQIDDNYLYQDKVLDIEEYSMIEEEVYDLVLEEEHLFFANGFYAHNSGRRGALMQTISIHHPESVIPWEDNTDGQPYPVKVAGDDGFEGFITSSKFYNPNKIDFVTAKYDKTKVTGANISCRLTDEFLNAVIDGKKYEQRWPVDSDSPTISKWVDAKSVWEKIIHSAWQTAEPGLLFWDNILRESPADCYADLGFRTISTNPCAELGLCANDSCRLLLVNLFCCVENPFTDRARFDFEKLYNLAQVAQRLMDDLVDIEIESINRIIEKIKKDPEPEEVKAREINLWKKTIEKCQMGRRTGTGITALGDSLAAHAIQYASGESIKIVDNIYRTLKLGCYRASVDMAKALGPFPIWDYEKESDHPFLNRIKEDVIEIDNFTVNGSDIYDDMKKYGRRNISLLTTAPTGSVSCLAKLVYRFGSSSGIEPQFSIAPYVRRKKGNPGDHEFRSDFVDKNGDHWMEFEIYPSAVSDWMDITGETDISNSPWANCCAPDIDWLQRVKLQAVAHKHVCHSISSTINLPENVSVENVAEIYETAWKYGCKGITVYRENCRTGVLIRKPTDNRSALVKTNAPKRPKELHADVHHITVKGIQYFVLLGMLGDEPYEVFAGKNGFIDRKCKTAVIEKIKRGSYRAIFDDGSVVEQLNDHISDEEAAITRLLSMSLRHGADLKHIVTTLEVVPGDMHNLARSIARALKKHIPDGTKITGSECPDCGSEEIIRQEGCRRCLTCGWTACN